MILHPWRATASWQTQAVFKQWVQTRPAPAGGVCPGSWHLVSGYPLLLVLVISEWGGRWSSPPMILLGSMLRLPCTFSQWGNCVLSSISNEVLTCFNKSQCCPGYLQGLYNLCFGIPGEKERFLNIFLHLWRGSHPTSSPLFPKPKERHSLQSL